MKSDVELHDHCNVDISGNYRSRPRKERLVVWFLLRSSNFQYDEISDPNHLLKRSRHTRVQNPLEIAPFLPQCRPFRIKCDLSAHLNLCRRSETFQCRTGGICLLKLILINKKLLCVFLKGSIFCFVWKMSSLQLKF